VLGFGAFELLYLAFGVVDFVKVLSVFFVKVVFELLKNVFVVGVLDEFLEFFSVLLGLLVVLDFESSELVLKVLVLILVKLDLLINLVNFSLF
jgi:hypothetical protein